MRLRSVIRREIDGAWDFLLPDYESSNVSNKNWKKVCAGLVF